MTYQTFCLLHLDKLKVSGRVIHTPGPKKPVYEGKVEWRKEE